VSAPAQPAPTRAAHRRRPSKPLERDEGLALRKIEHAITLRLAKSAERELLAEMSEYLDGLHHSACLDALCEERCR
jgi:hypothetical protein